jgi:tungstate transport system ATP-binding protein
MTGAGFLPLRLEGLTYALGGAILLGDVHLEIRPGRRVVVLGPNGAGKSMLLRLCHGLIQPTAGRIAVNGGGSGIGPAARARQAMVFQKPVHLRRSAIANLVWVLALRAVPARERTQRAMRALAAFDLAHLAERPARVLSGGEQQRLALARASLLEPELLLLDEPTASLDPTATRAVEAAIGAFHRQGVAILLTTHDLGQARRHADEILFLHRGRPVEQGPARSFFDAPRTPEARAFLAGELLT